MYTPSDSTKPARITDDNIIFLYEARAEIPAPDDKLYRFISIEYRRSEDEFTRHELAQKIKPVLEKKLSEALKTKFITVIIGDRLEEYDFDKSAFPTGISSGTYVPFDNGYAVTFENADKLTYLKVPFEKAKLLSRQLQRNRRTQIIIKAQIIGAEEKRLRWNIDKVLKTKISQLTLKLSSGKTVGTIKIK